MALPYEGLSRSDTKKVLKAEEAQNKHESVHFKKTIDDYNSLIKELIKVVPGQQSQLKNLQKSIAESQKDYQNFRKNMDRDVQQMKKDGASAKEINSYLQKNAEFYKQGTDAMTKALEVLHGDLENLADKAELSQDTNYILNKQLKLLEKSSKLEETYQYRKTQLDLRLVQELADYKKERAAARREKLKSQGAKLGAALLSTALGPFRLLTDPLMKMLNENNDTFTSLNNLFTGKMKNDSPKAKYKQDLKELKSEYNKEELAGKSLGKKNLDIMSRVTPTKSSLLEQGGVVGAVGVFIANAFGKDTAAKKAKGDSEKSSLFDRVLDIADVGRGRRGRRGLRRGKKLGGKKLGKILTKGSWKAAAPVAAIAVGAAMVGVAAKMQKRDSEDAKKYEGARKAETWLLGDRAHTTEETANKELGRTAGKTGLAVGGAGLAAAGVAGTATMIGTAASAGGIAAAGGLGALGTAGLATMGAVLPPVLIAGAVVAGAAVIAKGTQQAFELEWDKNQDSIQEDLHNIMYSEEASMGQKIKAGASSVWKGFTGTLAGGIREAGEIMDAETAAHKERQLELLQKRAEGGNEASANLLNIMSSDEFQDMSKKEQKAHMKKLGVWKEYKKTQSKTESSATGNVFRTLDAFVSGMDETIAKGSQGKANAKWQRNILKGKSFSSDEEKEAYIAEMKEKAIASGELDADGNAKNRNVLGKLFKVGTGVTRGVIGLGKAGGNMMDAFKHGGVKGGFSHIGTNIKEVFSNVSNGFSKVLGNIKGGFGKALGGINNIFSGGKDGFLNFMDKMKEGLKKTFKGIKSAFNNVKDVFEEGGIKGVLSFLGNSIKEWASEALAGLREKLGGIPLIGRLFRGGNNGSSGGSVSIEGSAEAITSRLPPGLPSGPVTTANDAIVTKDGKIIQLNQDDNIYATKNSFNAMDSMSQAAMPSVPKVAKEFTDENIVRALQVLIDILREKEMSPVVVSSGKQQVNFDQFRISHAI